MNTARALVLGFTLKENCPDVRNTGVIDFVRGLEDYGMAVDVHDPWVAAEDVSAEYDISLVEASEAARYDAVVLAFAHSVFIQKGAQALRVFGKHDHVLFDVKSCFCMDASDLRL